MGSTMILKCGSGVHFMDLKKAVDTVDHKLVLNKRKNTGLNEAVTSWFTSYLTNRQQITKCNSAISEQKEIKFRVPQESIWAPYYL